MSSDQPLSSTKNPAVTAAVRLHRSRHRRSDGHTLVEGPQVVGDAIAAGVVVHELFGLGTNEDEALADEAGVPLRRVTEEVLARVADTASPRGPVAIIDIPEPVTPSDGRVLLAWGVSDPGNCGTLLRTAAAFGYGFVAGPETADPWSPKVLRSAAGGHFGTTVGAAAVLGAMAERPLIATVPRGGEVPGPLPANAALIVGSEAHGLDGEVLAACDRLITIPMPGGSESLNAAVAGAITAYCGILGD